MADTSTGSKIVDQIIAGLGIFNVAFPEAAEAARIIIGIFRRAYPDTPLPTDADVIARLRSRATEDLDANQKWLAEHNA